MTLNLLKRLSKRSSFVSNMFLAPFFCSNRNISDILEDSETKNALFKEIIEEMTRDNEKIKNIEEVMEFYHSLNDSKKPSNLCLSDLDYMLTLSSSSIKKFLLSKKRLEKKKMIKSLKKEEIRSMKLESEEDLKSKFLSPGKFFDENSKPFYGKYNVSHFTYERFKRYRRLYNMANVCNNYYFAQHLLIDFDYDQYMTLKQHVILVNQLRHIIDKLIIDNNPFFLTFCNFNNDTLTCKFVNEYLKLYDLPFHITQKTYLDLFPKDKLVYLTPDTDNLLNYKYDDVYIIGAMIDSGVAHSFSLQKANENNIKKARLPMQEEVTLKKSLSHLKLIEVFDVLKDLKNGKSMQDSLISSIPSKVYKDNEEFEQFIKRHENKLEKRKGKLMEEYNMTLEEVLTIL